MKRALAVLVVMTVTAALALPGVSFAQEQEAEDMSYAYGTVVSITGSNMTVKEITYDENTGEEGSATKDYEIAPDVEIDNAVSISDVKSGSEVDIEYLEKDGKKTATYIYVYDKEEWE
ncbi:MAG: hypothetical protein ABIA77_05280 [Candidatus Omnitrophota bacterium]